MRAARHFSNNVLPMDERRHNGPEHPEKPMSVIFLRYIKSHRRFLSCTNRRIFRHRWGLVGGGWGPLGQGGWPLRSKHMFFLDPEVFVPIMAIGDR